MKKNMWQIAINILCVILMAIVIIQGKKLNELSSRLDNDLNYIRTDLQNQITNLSYSFERELEELDSVIASYEFQPTGIDKDTKKLLANANLHLKEWNDNTEVTLCVYIGSEKLAMATNSDGNGVFSATVELPCDKNVENEIKIDALINNGTVTKEESIGAWSDISMLLPLQMNGGGWSGPNYKNGLMNSHFNVSIKGLNSEFVVIKNPEFWVYKNGSLAQQLDAIQSTETYSDGKDYVINADNNYWSIECEEGDNIEIRFRCEDEYGLGYDFLFAKWIAVTDTNDNSNSANAPLDAERMLELYWPE